MAVPINEAKAMRVVDTEEDWEIVFKGAALRIMDAESSSINDGLVSSFRGFIAKR